MAVQKEESQIEIIVNSEQAATRLKEIGNISDEIKAKLNGMAKDNPERAQLKQQLKDLKKEAQDLKRQFDNRLDLVINGKAADETMRELQQASRKLWAELQKLPQTAADFDSKTQQYQQVQKRLVSLQETVKGTGGWFNKLKEEIGATGTVIAGYLGFQFLANQASQVLQKNAKLSDSLADIRRVAGLSNEEVIKLNATLSHFDTRTATAQLRDIAIVAGKLGIEKENIAAFTQEVDKLTVALGDELGSADQITETLGKILNVFDGKINAENISHLGNAIVVLANKGVATGGFIADFVQRISGIATASNLSLPAAVGLGAGLEELGQKVESSSTAIQKLIVTIGEDIPKAAKIAGAKTKQEVEEFTRLFAEKPEQALLKFAKGLTQNKQSFAEIATSFKDAGEEGARVISTLVQLGQKTEFFQGKIDLTSEAIKNNNALNDAFALKNDTLGAKLDKLGKKFYEFVSNGAVNNFLTGAVNGSIRFINALEKLSDVIGKNMEWVIAITGATSVYYARLVQTTAATILNTTAKVIANQVDNIHYALLIAREVATKAYGLAVEVLTGKITLATAAQRIWNAVGLLNPLGAILAGFTAIAFAIEVYSKNNAAAIALEKEKYQLNLKLINANNDLAKSVSYYNDQIARLNQLSPEQQRNLREDIALDIQSAKAKLEKLKADQAQLLLDASKPSTWQYLKNAILGFGNAAAAASLTAADAIKNGQEAAAAHNPRIEELSNSLKTLEGDFTTLDDKLTAEKRAMDIAAVSTEQYEEKLKLLKTALSGVALKGEDYNRIQKEIEATQEKLNKANNNAPPTNKQKQELQLQEEFYGKVAELQKHNEKLKLDILNNELEAAKQNGLENIEAQKKQAALELEIANKKADQEYDNEKAANKRKLEENNIHYKYDAGKREQLAKLSATELEGIEKKHQQEKQNIQDAYTKKNQKLEYNEQLSNLSNSFAKEKQLLTKNLQDKRITTVQFNDQSKKLEVDRSNAIIAIAKAFGVDYATVMKALADKVAGIEKDELLKIQQEKIAGAELAVLQSIKGGNKELEARKTLLQKKFDVETENMDKTSNMYKLKEEELKENLKEITRQYILDKISMLQQAFGQISNIISSFNTVENNKENAQLAKDKKDTDKKKSHFKDLLDHKVISQEQYDKEIENLDKTQNEKEIATKKKQFERDKSAKVVMATINTLLGVTRSIAEYPWPFNLVAAGITAAEGYAQVSAIQSEEAPEFEKGTKSFTGKLEGPDHKHGGLQIVDPVTGKIKGVMEGDEGLFSKKMRRNNTELVDAIFKADGNPVQPEHLPDYLIPKNTGAPEFETGTRSFGTVEEEHISKLKSIALKVLDSTDIFSREVSLQEFKDYSNQVVQIHKDRLAMQNALDELLHQSNIQRISDETETRKLNSVNETNFIKQDLTEIKSLFDEFVSSSRSGTNNTVLTEKTIGSLNSISLPEEIKADLINRINQVNQSVSTIDRDNSIRDFSSYSQVVVTTLERMQRGLVNKVDDVVLLRTSFNQILDSIKNSVQSETLQQENITKVNQLNISDEIKNELVYKIGKLSLAKNESVRQNSITEIESYTTQVYETLDRIQRGLVNAQVENPLPNVLPSFDNSITNDVESKLNPPANGTNLDPQKSFVNRVIQRINDLISVENYIEQTTQKLKTASSLKLQDNQQKIYFEQVASIISDYDDKLIDDDTFNFSKNQLEERLSNGTLVKNNEGFKIPIKKQHNPNREINPVVNDDDGILEGRKASGTLLPEITNRKSKTTFEETETDFASLLKKHLTIPEVPKWQIQDLPTLNLQRIIETSRVEKATEFVSTVKQLGIIPDKNIRGNSNSDDKYNEILKDIKTALSQSNVTNSYLHTTLSDIQRKGVKGVWEHRNFQDGLDDINSIKDSSNFGK